VAPIFDRASQSDEGAAFRWLQPMLGPKHTCLHGVHLTPRAAPKVALFDLDGTLILFQGFGAKSSECKWWRDGVPSKLKEVHDAGCVLFFSITRGVPNTMRARNLTASPSS